MGNCWEMGWSSIGFFKNIFWTELNILTQYYTIKILSCFLVVLLSQTLCYIPCNKVWRGWGVSGVTMPIYPTDSVQKISLKCWTFCNWTAVFMWCLSRALCCSCCALLSQTSCCTCWNNIYGLWILQDRKNANHVCPGLPFWSFPPYSMVYLGFCFWSCSFILYTQPLSKIGDYHPVLHIYICLQMTQNCTLFWYQLSGHWCAVLC